MTSSTINHNHQPLKLLAIETSGALCGFAMSVNGYIGEARYLDDRSSLSQRIIALIDATLRAARCDVHDLNGIAVSLGPGSWTGLRIGVATAKALVQGLNVPLVGVPTFDAVARSNIASRGHLVVVAPCRTGEVYAAVFNRDGNKIQAERVVKTDDLIMRLRGESTLTLCGEGAEEIVAALGERVTFISHFASHVLTGMTTIAHERLTQGNADDLFAVKPLYLAPSQAERVMGIQIE